MLSTIRLAGPASEAVRPVAVQLLIVYLQVLQNLFDTEPLAPAQLGVARAASTVAFIAVEIEKWSGAAPEPEVG